MRIPGVFLHLFNKKVKIISTTAHADIPFLFFTVYMYSQMYNNSNLKELSIFGKLYRCKMILAVRMAD